MAVWAKCSLFETMSDAHHGNGDFLVSIDLPFSSKSARCSAPTLGGAAACPNMAGNGVLLANISAHQAAKRSISSLENLRQSTVFGTPSGYCWYIALLAITHAPGTPS